MANARKRRTITAGGPLTAAILGVLLIVAGMIGPGGRGAQAASPATENVVFSGAGASYDTYIQQDEAGATHNGTTLAIVGDGNVGTDTWAGLAFDLSSIPGDATIQSATLTLTVSAAPAVSLAVSPLRLAAGSTWNESATWAGTQAAWSSGTLGAPVTVFNADGTAVFTVTSDVAAWVGGATNNGWSFHSIAGTDTAVFDSSEGSTAPSLSVTYATSVATLSPAGAYAADIAGGFEDTWVQLLSPATNRGGVDHLEVTLTASDRQDALIRFNLTSESPAIAAGRIVSATLTLPVTIQAASNRTFSAGRICTPSGLSVNGAVSAATYNGLPYNQFVSVDNTTYGYTVSDPDLEFDVTAIVQEWADGEPNHGFRIYQAGSVSIDSILLGSFNNSVDAKRPSLAIEYVTDTGAPNPTPSPGCQPASPTPTNTNTPTSTSTSTGTPSPTSTLTPTPTGTLTTTPTGTPAASSELVLTAPSLSVAVARSRLRFDATAGSLAPDSVSFVIRRTADDMFWNADTSLWEASLVSNAGVNDSGTWSFVVSGTDRRAFVDTTISVEVQATAAGSPYTSASVSVTVR